MAHSLPQGNRALRTPAHYSSLLSKDGAETTVKPASWDVTHNARPTRSTYSSAFRRHIENSWIWEILASIFSLVCLMVIIIVLHFENGRELGQWRLKIAPNAVISFIGTLAKSSFMLAIVEIISQLKWLHFRKRAHRLSDLHEYDQSSRGPWGATKFVFFQHKNALLACWAALITIAALVVDPSLQLVFSYPSQLSVDHQAAPSFPITTVYDPNNYLYDEFGAYYAATSVNTEMQASILSGLFDTIPPPSMFCPGTSCNWTDVTTLGVCGDCTDTIADVATSCDTPWRDPNGRQQPARCNYTMPNAGPDGLMLEGRWINYGKEPMVSTLWNSTGVDLSGQPEENNNETLLAMFSAVKIANGSITEPAPIGSPPSQAYLCGFNLCARHYFNITSVNATGSVRSAEGARLMIRNNTFDSSGTKRMLTLVPRSRTPGTESAKAEFTINEADFRNLGAYLSELFSVSLMSRNKIDRQAFQNGTWANGNLYSTPPIGSPLFQSSDLPATVDAIADGMTEGMRTSVNGTSVIGQSFVPKTFIAVDWRWLALPVALVVMTLILLIIVAAKSHRTNVVSWKSSGLALLFHKLEGWHEGNISMANNHELKKTASNMVSRLDVTSDRHVFVRQD